MYKFYFSFYLEFSLNNGLFNQSLNSTQLDPVESLIKRDIQQNMPNISNQNDAFKSKRVLAEKLNTIQKERGKDLKDNCTSELS